MLGAVICWETSIYAEIALTCTTFLNIFVDHKYPCMASRFLRSGKTSLINGAPTSQLTQLAANILVQINARSLEGPKLLVA